MKRNAARAGNRFRTERDRRTGAPATGKMTGIPAELAPSPPPPPPYPPTMSSSEPVRLQKFIAEAGICSRRAAEAMIAQGEVWVNGAAATLGQKITPGVDRV